MSDTPAAPKPAREPDDALTKQLKALLVGRAYFQSHLADHEATSFLESRKVDARTAKRFQIGYAPDSWRGLVDHFSSHTIRLAAIDAGLLTTPATSNRALDFFRGRIMFPIHAMSGEVIGYGGRILVNDPEKKSPKYINTPETALFKKSEQLYGLYHHQTLIRSVREAFLVEGYMDVIRMSSAGFCTAVAPMGTAVTEQQIALLKSLGVRKLWLCLDGDSAGQKAAQRSLDVIMKEYDPALEVMLIQLPDNHDPDSFISDYGSEAFSAEMAKAIDLPTYIHQLLIQGIPEKPCLEDKALYLHRLEKYTDLCAGFLLETLLKQASAYSGLTIDQIATDSVRQKRAGEFGAWHRLVAHAARWMMFDEAQAQIANRFKSIKAETHGLPDLAKMANQILAKEQHTTVLHRFAIAHGPLSDEEFSELQKDWIQWFRPTMLEHHFTQVRENPNDAVAKQAIRSMMMLR